MDEAIGLNLPPTNTAAMYCDRISQAAKFTKMGLQYLLMDDAESAGRATLMHGQDLSSRLWKIYSSRLLTFFFLFLFLSFFLFFFFFSFSFSFFFFFFFFLFFLLFSDGCKQRTFGVDGDEKVSYF